MDKGRLNGVGPGSRSWDLSVVRYLPFFSEKPEQAWDGVGCRFLEGAGGVSARLYILMPLSEKVFLST